MGCSHTKRGPGTPSLGIKEDGLDPLRSRNVSDGERGGTKAFKELPCRIAVSVQGLEWFVYNRTPAYDAIVTSMSGAEIGADGHFKCPNSMESPSGPEEDSTGNTYFKNDSRDSRQTLDYSMKPPHRQHAEHARSSDSEKISSPITLDEKVSPLRNEDTTQAVNALLPASNDVNYEPSDSDRHGSVPASNILRILPVYIECNKGAIVLGNENTRTVLTAKFDNASGQVDATYSRPADQYKQMLNFDFTRPLVQMRANADFQQSQLSAAARVKKEEQGDTNAELKKRNHQHYNHHNHRLWHTLREWIHYFQIFKKSFPSPQNTTKNSARPVSQGAYPVEDRWLGLSRYLNEDEQDERDGWKPVEYARVSTVLDSPSIGMNFYWDVPGLVPQPSHNRTALLPGYRNDINGDLPPEWGIDLQVRGGDIHYGPWTDRERVDLQAVFFPNPYKDAVPTPILKAGQPRVSTVFRLRVDIEEQTTLRIPFREESKDWKWKGRADAIGGVKTQHRQPEKKKWGIGKKGNKGGPGPDIRPFGWLDVKVQPDSTISYTMDMFPGARGFSNKLDIDLHGTEMSSSVNHGLLWRSANQILSCDLSNPLEWNALHQWKFDIASTGVEVFLLRDHIFLLTDLINDWTSGPPADFYTFIPFRYLADLRFAGFKLYLNANDSNIINNPSDVGDNTFVVVWGEELTAAIGIPLDNYRPARNAVTFEVDARDGGFELRTPLWNTQNTFLDNMEIASLKELRLTGSYDYCTSTSASFTDTLILDLHGAMPSVHLYGFLVRYLMKLKDNYFGEDLHFRTLEEFQGLLANQESHNHPDEAERESQHGKKSNDLDVLLSVKADGASALLPANLYSAKENVKFDIASVVVDLRFTNYYMDLEVNFSPLSVSLKSSDPGITSVSGASSSPQVFVDGLNIYGHRLFGLPPSEPTYVCNWDFRVGAVHGQCSTDFLRTLSSALRVFIFSFDDDENALPSIHPNIIHDVTFLRANTGPIRLWLLVDEVAILISTDALSVKFNDWAGENYSERLNAVVPALTLTCVDARTASHYRRMAHYPVPTLAYFQTTVNITLIERKLEFTKDREFQQNHLRVHDQRTRRTEWLLREKDEEVASVPSGVRSKINAPAMPFPSMPEPIAIDTKARTHPNPISSNSGYVYSRLPARDTSRKSSFLSFGTSNRSSDGGAVKARIGTSEPSCSDGNSITNGRNNSNDAESSMRSISRTRGHLATAHRRQSYQSQIRDEGPGRSDVDPCSTTCTSSYATPYFPLGAIEPDLKDVPDLPDHDTSYQTLGQGPFPVDDDLLQGSNENVVQTSFIITLSSGLKAYCSPEALYSFSTLLSHLQPKDPIFVLDSLQMDVLNEILSHAKRKSRIGKTTDITLRVPYAHVRFVNPFTSVNGFNSNEEQDQYNLILSRLTVAARSKFKAPVEDFIEDGEQMSALHLAMDSFSFFVEERSSEATNEKVAIRADIGDLVLWVLSGQTLSANLRFRHLDLITSSKNFEYLAFLIQRTSLLGTCVTKAFEAPMEQQKMRLRHLTYALTMLGGSVPDPPFLTRPSYVLRSATDHIRINDSWKIISRFRYMYQNLAEHERSEVLTQCKNNVGQCPSDVASRVSESFDRWRSWDLGPVRKSYVIQRIYGTMPGVEKVHALQSVPINAAINGGVLRMSIDPGPKQNELTIDTLTIVIAASVSPTSMTMAPSLNIPTARTTVIQIHCVKIVVDLHWELWDLFEDVQKLYKTDRTTEHTSPVPSSPPNTLAVEDQQYHFIVTADTGSVTLDSINLKLISLSKGPKVSIVTIHRRGVRKDLVATILLHADAATSQFVSHTSVVASSKLWHPKICASYTNHAAGNVPTNVWKLAGSCRELLCEVQEDLLSLIALINVVIGDEIAYVHRVLHTFRDQPARKASTMAASTGKSTNQANIALSLDEYRLSLALLPSLTYVISGDVARTLVSLRQDSQAAVDFDLNGQSHDLETRIDGKTQKFSLLEVPPINGRVIIRFSDIETAIEVYTTVETIVLDPKALHGLLDTLNRPEISYVVQDVRKDLESLKNRLRTGFDGSQSSQPVGPLKSSQPVFYKAHTTIAEVGIHAVAPGASSGAVAAHIDFSLGSVLMKAANRLELGGGVLEYPEISVNLRQVLLQLKRSDNLNTQMCGDVGFAASISCTTKHNEAGDHVRAYHIKSDSLEVNLFADTASTIVDVAGYLQDKVKSLDLSKEVKYPRRLQSPNPQLTINDVDLDNDDRNLFGSMYSLEMLSIQIIWAVGESTQISSGRVPEDLVLSFTRIDLATRKENAARLMIEGFQLQMVPTQQGKRDRTLNSALLPEVVFNVAHLSTKKDRRLAFQAAGKSLDLRLTSQFVLPASDLQRSIALASEKLRAATATWAAMPSKSGAERMKLLGNKRLASLLIDADFAGAVVYIQGRRVMDSQSSASSVLRGARMPQHGRYGQFTHEDASSSTTLRAPGIAFKVEYKDSGTDDPSLNAEIKVDASSHKLYPTVVPLIMEISSSIKEVVGEPEETGRALHPKPSTQKFLDEGTLRSANPNAILGKCKLNVGLQICRQEFGLSCQPIARVAAIARFEDIYFTVNTVQSVEHSRFFAVSAVFTKLQASVQHVYSRESTANFDVDSIVVSLMNSKHVSDANGLSAILKISPMKAQINAKQLHDFLLFREIWVPPEIRQSPSTSAPTPASGSQAYTVQRYQQVAAAGAFPWNATISVAELNIQLDMGQALGKSALVVSNFWISTKKTSDWEQNLCLGFHKLEVNSSGRMSGFVELQSCRVRTSIQWPLREKALNQTPLIQASLGFDELRVKAAFDYQAFLITDIISFEFLMYNVRDTNKGSGDRLVGILDGDKVQVFCTSTSASQGLALYQAFQRIIQEKQAAYETSLKDIEKFLRRKSTINPAATRLSISEPVKADQDSTKTPISLHTDVMVTLRAINIGTFPSTFFDNQVFKFEASNAQASFAVVLEKDRIHSGLGLNLGQLRIALSGVRRPNVPKALGEVAVDDVISSVTESRGGTILKVPKVVANMQTWHTPESNHIDYIFTSSFEGKVDVGWNYSRISFIRGMWANHSRSLGQRLGKPLRQSAVQITGGPRPEVEGEERRADGAEQEKITAVVNVPQSRYDYTAVEIPIIETPQLRDMGEATPPLEWIGLQRDRLPHLTHQLIIVTLLEVAKEVEDAYSKILGSS